MSVGSEINTWIVENQALSISIGVPLFTVLVGLLGSYLTSRAKNREVRLSARMKLTDLRKENFDELKQDIGLLHGEFRKIGLRVMYTDGSGGFTIDDLHTIYEPHQRISVRIRSEKELRDELTQEVERLVAHIVQYNPGDDIQLNLRELRRVCSKILDSEWRQIESDLRRLA
ncbi:MAG: hypothetical protein AB3N22_14435 [Ruegeria sp.]